MKLSSSGPVRTTGIGRRPAPLSRLLASVAYLGCSSAILLAVTPRDRFVVRHSIVALWLYLVRLVGVSVVLVVWYTQTDNAESGRAALDFLSLMLLGVPWMPRASGEFLLWLSLPLGMTWVLSAVAIAVAATGKTLDFSAMLNADWTTTAERRLMFMQDAERAMASRPEDRAWAREVIEQRLARFWNASRVAVMEGRRRERMKQIRDEMDAVTGRLNHLNQMLALGEFSIARFNAVHTDLVTYLNGLQVELSDLEFRRTGVNTLPRPTARPLSLDTLPDVRALTLAIVDASGMPLITYGHFRLDESLITGMVSALDSLTVEMFGSQVHKTQLAKGQVVHFYRGGVVIAFALFEDDPSPAQIERLQVYVTDFELANREVLSHLPVDQSRLQPIAPPFQFIEPDFGSETSLPLTSAPLPTS